MNFRTLDLNLLRVFDVVMVERNVTRAAAQLAMTQPAVSNALRRLRESTREDLFIPTSTGVTPTPHAQTLWPTVRAALGGLHDAFDPQGFDPRHRCAHASRSRWPTRRRPCSCPSLVSALQREQAQVDLRFVHLATRDPRSVARARHR